MSLRARTRAAVRDQVVDSALELFLRHGYDAVTVEQIASSVGLSRRSLHRYFSSKDDIMLCRYDSLGDVFVTLLRARPLTEDAWTSLRHVFTEQSAGDQQAAGREAEAMGLVRASPSLYAGFLERSQRAQGQLADVLRDREARRHRPVDPDDPRFDAIVAAACACRTVALTVSESTGTDFERSLELTMSTLTPTQRG